VPRAVDADDRRREIATAALRLISTKGYRALTLRAVAAELNGSLTLVTHYYASREELLKDMATQLMSQWDEELATLERDATDASERLRLFLEWMIPMDEQGELEERARIILAAETRSEHPDIQETLNTWDLAMRSALQERVAAVIEDPEEVKSVAEILRVFTNGVVLSVIEHPDEWPSERQGGVLDRVLSRLNLQGARSTH
jgi:AcrR family transcriptional regulator